jgi:hypothetical protein
VNTDQLIERLVADVKPVRRLLAPTERAALWTALALVAVATGVVYFGVRHDIASVWSNAGLLARLVLLATTMWLSVVAAFRLSVPGGETRAFARWWPLVLLGVLVAVSAGEVVAAWLVGDPGSPLRSWTCVRKVAFVGAVPAIVSIVLISRGFAVEPRWTAMLGVLAAGAAGALTSELACPIQAPVHIMLWHIAPVVVSTAVGALVGTLVVERMLRRRSAGR